jgi:hypothetical protein
LVGVSYRLTPETGERLLGEFAEAADDLRLTGTHFAFGGTPPVAEKARQLGFFERVFDGSQTPEEVLAYLKGQTSIQPTELDFPGSTVERIRWKSPFPLLRHHFGLPTMEDSLSGVEKISKAKVLDVISLGMTRMPRKISSIPSGKMYGVRGLVECLYALRMTIECFMLPAAREIILSCGRIQGQMTLSAWQRCTLKRSTMPGAPSPCFGLIKWMAEAHGIWKSPYVSIRA